MLEIGVVSITVGWVACAVVEVAAFVLSVAAAEVVDPCVVGAVVD